MPGDKITINDTKILINDESISYPGSAKYFYSLFYRNNNKDTLIRWAEGNEVFLESYARKANEQSMSKALLTTKQYEQLSHASFVDSITLFSKDNRKLNNTLGTNGKNSVNSNMSVQQSPKNILFPHIADNHWTLHNYGPLKIPEKNMSMELSTHTALVYKSIIENYEGDSVQIDSSLVKVNGEGCESYTFSKNYYFLLGDNRDQSQDSRYWGFVPEEYIIGKASFLLFSSRFEKLKKGRFLKKIK